MCVNHVLNQSLSFRKQYYFLHAHFLEKYLTDTSSGSLPCSMALLYGLCPRRLTPNGGSGRCPFLPGFQLGLANGRQQGTGVEESLAYFSLLPSHFRVASLREAAFLPEQTPHWWPFSSFLSPWTHITSSLSLITALVGSIGLLLLLVSSLNHTSVWSPFIKVLSLERYGVSFAKTLNLTAG